MFHVNKFWINLPYFDGVYFYVVLVDILFTYGFSQPNFLQNIFYTLCETVWYLANSKILLDIYSAIRYNLPNVATESQAQNMQQHITRCEMNTNGWKQLSYR